MHNDKKFAILGGMYISPFAQSICGADNSDIMDGLIMDATWKTISGYVTSILMASIFSSPFQSVFLFLDRHLSRLYLPNPSQDSKSL